MVDWRRTRGVASGMALALIVALAGCGGTSSGKTSAATTPAAPTIAPTQTPSPPGVWASLSSCGGDVPGAVRVQYQTPPGGYTIQRSDDCGATWNTVASPQIPGVSGSAFIALWSVSPAPGFPDTVYLTAQVNDDQRLCSASVCQVQYVSTNGGKTWAELRLPSRGFLGALQVAQPLASGDGTRLYGIVTDELVMVGPGPGTKQTSATPPMRLVVSTDHGAIWKLCDAPIAAHGWQVIMYAAPPAGADLFMLAQPQNDLSANPTHSLWVSHDAGVTWSSSGPTPGTGTSATREGVAGGVVSALFTAMDIASGRDILYLAVVVSGHERAMGSADGGQTWQGDPKLVLDADANGYSPTIVGALPDGSLLIQYPNGDGGTIAWKPGSFVRTVAQNPGFRDFFNPLVVPEGTGIVLWLSGDSGPDATPGVKYVQLRL